MWLPKVIPYKIWGTIFIWRAMKTFRDTLCLKMFFVHFIWIILSVYFFYRKFHLLYGDIRCRELSAGVGKLKTWSCYDSSDWENTPLRICATEQRFARRSCLSSSYCLSMEYGENIGRLLLCNCGMLVFSRENHTWRNQGM